MYRGARHVYDSQMVRYKKLESELHPLPRSFNLKLMASFVATPDEIAEALSDPAKRKLWDLNIESIT